MGKDLSSENIHNKHWGKKQAKSSFLINENGEG